MDLGQSFQILQGMIRDMASAPDGISTGETARRYGISQRAVLKYIGILEASGVPIYNERNRYFLDESYHAAFTLTPEESEFLYLALERSLVFHSQRWRTMRSLLRKLGSKMTLPLADLLPKFDSDRGDDPADQWFSRLAYARQERVETWVLYHPLNRPEPSRWLIRPYRFTSNPLSDGMYVLCEGTTDGENFTPLSLKFDRILRVEVTDQKFAVLDTARFSSYDGRAWGVWNSDRDPVEVILQFEPRHYDRLLETIWHPTQSLRVDQENVVYFSVSISEPQEMIPWIRSWGSGVVVLEPEDLRQRMIWSLQRQLRAYGLDLTVGAGEAQPSILPHLWAKYERKTGAYHALLYHLLDVAAVAWVMWERTLSASQRTWLTDLFGLDANGTQHLLAFMAGLHDIGKATPGFQRKAEPLFDRLVALGLPDERFDEPHGVLSTIILREQFSMIGLERAAASQLAAVIGGHHGAWISRNQARYKTPIGKQLWRDLQAEIFQTLRTLLDVQQVSLSADAEVLNKLSVFLSGFVSVCDWIGSTDSYFPYETDAIEPQDYFQRAISQAEMALAEMGWVGWQPPRTEPQFERMFPFAPNDLQKSAIAACDFASGAPRLILVEYLTGGGKTELALYLADYLVNWLGQAGVYVAMPTQATSNQMFERVGTYLQARYPGQAINIQLIHAQAEQHPFYQQLPMSPVREGDQSGLTAAEWFQNRKRSLLAPFAVGTVDQAMLSVMQARHHFVRQYGLSHKTLIFDEVHAYDTYMNEIIQRLLSWLVALQSPAILLSATLPRKSRLELLQAVGANVDGVPVMPYPRLTFVEADGTVQVHSLPAPETRMLRINRIPADVNDLCEWLASAYQQDGCFAVICNTVDESITVAQALASHPGINADDVLLFHARFPPEWRSKIEGRVLQLFGKNGERPERMILVATQIIEQSLDLDFDLMVTSTAPIDLLIQRAGRLHRHAGRLRPAHLNDPVLLIREPNFEGGLPNFGVDEVIYTRYLLLKTWLLLQDRTALHIPDEIDTVMDFVYGEEAVPTGSADAYAAALEEAWETMAMGANGAAFRGKTYRIAAPDDEELVGNSSFDLPDDEQIRITTRDMLPGIDIICLRSADMELPLPERPPRRDEIQRLLRFRITIRSKATKQALEALPKNPHWSRVPQLRAARPVMFEGETFAIPGSSFTLRLTPFYGLEILKEKL